MPFTFSHPALILPLAYLPKTWISLTGLILGSIAPDFEKFIKMKLASSYSHTWSSIFYFSLPIALLFSFVYHLVVRDVLIDHLPNFLKQRLFRFKSLNWVTYFKKNYVVIIISIVIGAASHITLDNLTHKYGAFVSYFPFLQHKLYFSDFRLSLVRILDITCSLMGGIGIFYFLISLPVEPIPNKPFSAKFTYWVIVALGASIIFFLRLSAGLHLQRVWDVGISFISAALISLVISSLLHRKLLADRL